LGLYRRGWDDVFGVATVVESGLGNSTHGTNAGLYIITLAILGTGAMFHAVEKLWTVRSASVFRACGPELGRYADRAH
jgi:hypothetical protein